MTWRRASRPAFSLTRGALLAACLLLTPAVSLAAAGDEAAITRGAYVFRAAGCYACHTDEKNKGAPLAGGRALKTPFGTFYTPNITPDPRHGIGTWSEEDFLRALREGVDPDGRHYFPAFPFTSYSGMSDGDARDLLAYLRAQPPVDQANREHEIDFPFRYRILMGPWKMLFFSPGRFQPDPGRSDARNRGAYLVRHLGHCGECHSPRNAFGAIDESRALAGNPSGPEGKKVPNITPERESGIGKWRPTDLTYFLKSGFYPDGDYAGGAMTDVVEEATGHLSDGDLAAIVEYILSLPPLAGP